MKSWAKYKITFNSLNWGGVLYASCRTTAEAMAKFYNGKITEIK